MDDLDADTELLYELAKATNPTTPSRNLERTRRKPQRYGQLEVNCITALSSNNNRLASKRRGSAVIKLWQLGLLLTCCLIIPLGNASPNKTTAKEILKLKENMRVGLR